MKLLNHNIKLEDHDLNSNVRQKLILKTRYEKYCFLS